ncbi:hypothetical protein GJAV_G00193220 [Gymnothorax javanicus]|nr:hypothetical protein GJAV_G00193220 [Gymnothorax javanicus]
MFIVHMCNVNKAAKTHFHSYHPTGKDNLCFHKARLYYNGKAEISSTHQVWENEMASTPLAARLRTKLGHSRLPPCPRWNSR